MNNSSERLVIDFHAHILPCLDHGSHSISESVSQLRLAKEAGVDIIIASSHFYPQETTLERFLPAREAAYSNLCKENLSEFPKIVLGAEVLFCEHLSRMEGLDALRIGGDGPLLLEMPFGKWRSEWFDELFLIKKKLKGKVILAHVDRYDRKYVQFLLDAGFCAQLNASAFDKFFFPSAYKKWIREGKIFAIGSDIHGTKTGYEQFLRAKEKLGDDFQNIMDRSKALLGID